LLFHDNFVPEFVHGAPLVWLGGEADVDQWRFS
jgi:hypothetical protein